MAIYFCTIATLFVVVVFVLNQNITQTIQLTAGRITSHFKSPSVVSHAGQTVFFAVISPTYLFRRTAV